MFNVLKAVGDWSKVAVLLSRGIALEQAIPPVATHFSVAWSVCLSSVTFVHPAYTVQRI